MLEGNNWIDFFEGSLSATFLITSQLSMSRYISNVRHYKVSIYKHSRAAGSEGSTIPELGPITIEMVCVIAPACSVRLFGGLSITSIYHFLSSRPVHSSLSTQHTAHILNSPQPTAHRTPKAQSPKPEERNGDIVPVQFPGSMVCGLRSAVCGTFFIFVLLNIVLQ